MNHGMTQDEGGEKNLIWQYAFLYLLQEILVFSSERRNRHVLLRRHVECLFFIKYG